MYLSLNYHINFSLFNCCSCLLFELFCPHLIYLYLLQMTIKGGLFVLVLTALVVRSSTPIARQCFPSGFLCFQPLMQFKNAEDTGFLWMYVLYTPPRPKKLSRSHILLRTRSLILVILLIGCVESNPCEFL